MVFPGGSAGKESACNARDLHSIPGLGRFPGKGKGYPLQYSDLENFMDCIVHGVAKSSTTERLSLSLLNYVGLLFWIRVIMVKESESEVSQSCPTLCNPVDCSPPGSSVHRILQARILEWVAISFSRGSSQPRDGTQVSRIAGRRFNL